MYEIGIKILNILNDKGYEAYIVGGFARDYYMGYIGNDLDICTNALPSEIKKIFNNIISDNSEYGVIKIKYCDKFIEIASFRKDISYKNRKPIIEFTNNIKEDLLRRDFRMNTLCIDLNGNYIDFYGAIEDINNKMIRMIGKSNRLTEDCLRMLRAIRFATILDFNLEIDIVTEIKENKELLRLLSYNRKKDELDKIFNCLNCKKGIELLIEFDLENSLDLKNLKNINRNVFGLNVWSQLDCINYPFKKNELKIISNIKKLLNEKIDKYSLYKYGQDLINSVYEIKGKNIDVIEEYNNLVIYTKEDINISTNDLINFIDNKEISKVYKVLEKEIVNLNLVNQKQAIIDFLFDKNLK
ncbi:MAG: hypothetical protein ACK5HP_01425 [Bacilli bacterium]